MGWPPFPQAAAPSRTSGFRPDRRAAIQQRSVLFAGSRLRLRLSRRCDHPGGLTILAAVVGVGFLCDH